MRLLDKMGIHNGNEFKCLLVQFFKFGLVGISNTIINYGVEIIGFYVLFNKNIWSERLKILVVTILGFIISVLNSYYWNSYYVFSDPGMSNRKPQLLSFLKMTICYVATGLILAPILKIWIHEAGVAYWLSSLFTLSVTIPLNFLINKYWTFRK